MYQGKNFEIADFSGGYCGNLQVDQLATNQASDLANIILKPGGKGFRARYGSTKFNAGSLTGPAQGAVDYRQSGGSYWFALVSGAKFYHSASFSGTFTDATGGYAGITSGASNFWDLFTFQDILIGFGGSATAPDAPIKWTGSGNVAALGGTSPSAYGGFTTNNRVFAFRTSANPSSIYWSIIGSSTDFTGAGSGSAVVGSFADNQSITAAVVLSTNYVLVFKENSTYQMVISSAPFPIYTLFDNVGCAGKKACVNIDGEVYFITKNKQMKSTDGNELKSYPQQAQDLWANVSDPSKLVGYRHRGSDFDWLVWIDPTYGYQIIWDLLNKCWLRTSYFDGPSTAMVSQGGQPYILTASNPTNIYATEQSGVYTDNSESLTAFWQSGYLNPAVADEIIQVRKALVQYATYASGNLTFYWRFDYAPSFVSPPNSFTLALAPTTSEARTARSGIVTSRGNLIQFQLTNGGGAVKMDVSKVLLQGKVYGQKRIASS